MLGHMYGAIPRTTEPEPETDTETEMGNGTFNIRDFGLSTRIRSYVGVIFSVCLSLMFVRTRYLLRLSVPYVRMYALSSPSVCPYTSLTYGVSFTSQQSICFNQWSITD